MLGRLLLTVGFVDGFLGASEGLRAVGLPLEAPCVGVEVLLCFGAMLGLLRSDLSFPFTGLGAEGFF